MGTNLYPDLEIGNQTSSLWSLTSGSVEIDLRKEMHDLLHGSSTEIAKGHPAILRRMRRVDGELVQCACVDTKTREPDKDSPCPYCWGEGYIWDEEWITIYKTYIAVQARLIRQQQIERPGTTSMPFLLIYLEHQVEPSHVDKIIDVSLTVDGNIVIPYKREAVYTIATAEPFRSDNGRVEYWRTACLPEGSKATWEV